MTSKDLEAIFAPRAIREGHVLFYDERSALALIEAAQVQDVAVVGIDHCRPSENERYAALTGRPPALVDRAESWRQAREFIAYFSGKNVLFEVALEPPHATRRIRARDRTVVSGFWRPRFLSVFLSVGMMIFLTVWLFVLAGF